MNREIRNFLDAGRTFRQRNRRGHFLLVEKDINTIRLVSRWFLDATSQMLWFADTPVDIMDEVLERVKCVVVDADAFEPMVVRDFVERLERDHTGVVTVLYSKSLYTLSGYKIAFPRIATVCGGEGFAELLGALGIDVSVNVAEIAV